MTTISSLSEFEPVSYNGQKLSVGMAVYQINHSKEDLTLIEGKIIEILPDKKMIKIENIMSSPSGRVSHDTQWEAYPKQVHTDAMQLLQDWLKQFYREAHWNLPRKIQRIEGYIASMLNKEIIRPTNEDEPI